ncbi:hypothetical protein [Brevundimonas vesicularis]|uniref:hypothetical protein n=1 Tax=Brevundimonas vesicularis TaxID=41276 RepID=UPI0038D4D5BA
MRLTVRLYLPAALTGLAALTLASGAWASLSQEAPTPGTGRIEAAPDKDGLIDGDPALDWTLTEFPERKALLATAAFDNGLTLATRCVNGVFEATVHGLREASGLTRTIQITHEDSEPYDTSWIIGDKKDAAFSRVPVRFARTLAKGGQVQMRIAGERGQPATRYILDLPPSVSAVEQTLAACGKSMVDLRYDALGDENSTLPDGANWLRRPQPSFPTPSGQMMSTHGYVTISCGVRADGRPQDCLVESEYPAGFNFGRATLRAVEKGQIGPNDPTQTLPPNMTILFHVNFQMR